jgi:hypothetical protein
MTIRIPFEVYRLTAGIIDDEPLATFEDRTEAFDYARAFAIEHGCHMLVAGPAKMPEVQYEF